MCCDFYISSRIPHNITSRNLQTLVILTNSCKPPHVFNVQECPGGMSQVFRVVDVTWYFYWTKCRHRCWHISPIIPVKTKYRCPWCFAYKSTLNKFQVLLLTQKITHFLRCRLACVVTISRPYPWLVSRPWSCIAFIVTFFALGSRPIYISLHLRRLICLQGTSTMSLSEGSRIWYPHLYKAIGGLPLTACVSHIYRGGPVAGG